MIGEREKEVLKHVVENHLHRHAPVGSRTLSRLKINGTNLSSATIRNIMADLDEMGLIAQPHTSAGRIPTDKGYRYFIDNLMEPGELPDGDRRMIDRCIADERAPIADRLERISCILSTLSSQVGLLLIPHFSSSAIKKFHFIKISEFTVQVVLVTVRGDVRNLLVEVDENWSDDELTQLANYVNARYAGHTLRQVRQKLETRVKRESERIRRLRERALKIQEKIFSQQQGEEVLVEGVSSFLDVPEFKKDTQKLKRLFDALSNKQRLLLILDKCLDKKEAWAEVGMELPLSGFEECSLVSCGYGLDAYKGAIGVIGPRHMNYPYAFSLLEYISGALNRKFQV